MDNQPKEPTGDEDKDFLEGEGIPFQDEVAYDKHKENPTDQIYEGGGLPWDLSEAWDALKTRAKRLAISVIGEDHDCHKSPEDSCVCDKEIDDVLKGVKEENEAQEERLNSLSHSCVKELEDLFNETWIPSPEEEQRAKRIVYKYLIKA